MVGHTGFANRGCEAIVRCTAELLRQTYPGLDVVASSLHYHSDVQRGAPAGVTMIPAVPKWWNALPIRLLAKACWGSAGWRLATAPLRGPVRDADVVLSVGGDTYTADYGIPRYFLAVNRCVFDEGRPLVIWGASVGPYENAALREIMVADLRRASLITARETATVEYLESIGVQENVRLVGDPAFLLEPEEIELADAWPEGDGFLGLNVSPHLGGSAACATDAACELASYAMDRHNLGIVLIPHVTGARDDDHVLLREVYGRLSRPERTMLLPQSLSAAQTKYVISRCRFLVAARTHATIAGFSSCVPTLSLAYSQKAHGLNTDLFDETTYMVNTRGPEWARDVAPAFARLVANEDSVRSTLQQRVPIMQERARAGARLLAPYLDRGASADGT